MKILEHPVEIFDDENHKHHAAHWIMQVVDDSNPTTIEEWCGYKGIGYYFICEDEASVIGGFETFDKAVYERDNYFKQLMK